MGFGNMQSSGGGSVSWGDITGKPLEFNPLMGNLGDVLFVSRTGSDTQTRADGVGRIDKPFSLQRAFEVSANGDTIRVLGGVSNLYDEPYYLLRNISGRKTINVILEGCIIAGLLNIQNLGTGFSINFAGISQIDGQANIENIVLDNGGSIGLNFSNLLVNALEITALGSFSVKGQNAYLTGIYYASTGGRLEIEGRDSFVDLNTISLNPTQKVNLYNCSGNIIINGKADLRATNCDDINFKYVTGTTSIELTEDAIIYNCISRGFNLVREMAGITTWSNPARRLKIINCASPISIQDATDPSVLAQIDTYNSVVI